MKKIIIALLTISSLFIFFEAYSDFITNTDMKDYIALCLKECISKNSRCDDRRIEKEARNYQKFFNKASNSPFASKKWKGINRMMAYSIKVCPGAYNSLPK